MSQIVKQAQLVNQPSVRPDQVLEHISIFTPEGLPLLTSVNAPTGDAVLLTGLSAGPAEEVSATDSVNEAIAKLQAQIDEINES